LLAELPLYSGFTIIVSIVSYFITEMSLEDGDQLWIFVLVNLLMSFMSQGLGLFLGVFARDTSVGVQLLPVLAIVEFIFCGYMINLDDIPEWLAFLEYISAFKYAWAAL
jgi:ABC-type multidrug transport system permease subunit